MSYSIYDGLKKRAEGKDSKCMERRLNKLLDDIKADSEGHLSRVNEFMPGYDDHSVKHAESVLNNIDRLIGEDGIKKHSVYDLFILAASSYLHDWGMALTDYENNVLLLAEKEPLPVMSKGIEACNNIIKENVSTIFDGQLQDALDIVILPSEKPELFGYLSDLYQKYQDFRNGYTEKYKKAEDENEKQSLNESIRVEYIRCTHHTRSADYVNNWGNCIKNNDINLSQVMYDVACVVQSHGESHEYVKKLGTITHYEAIDDDEDSNKANNQFASTMLRLGDIVHFTFDRAPANLRKEILFKSDGKKHWIAKNGVSNKINNGKIEFIAKCELPRSYCYLKKYIEYINDEVVLFRQLQLNWEERYQIPLVDVVDHINPLNNAFETRPDLTFSLNQNKIIELLMGVQLYEDPYTCLRELYQNSLDACRCAISRRKNPKDANPKCTIEFGVKQDKGGKYIYCLDDGKGMSRHIIENYFLNIGSSYYKSKAFFTEYYQNGVAFTPTSQFGIGILSCFIIGDRLEVVTKEYEGELIFFGVDGPQETFYYWNNNKICREDKETFNKRQSGTLVKVYLKEQYAKELDDGELDKFELLKCGVFDWNKIKEISQSGDYEKEEEKKYVDLFRRWECHIYRKIYDFVQVPFPEIEVKVFFAGQSYPIEARPHLANVVSDDFKHDKKYYDRYTHYFDELNKNSDMEEYPFQICRANYIYHSMLCLPKKGWNEDYNEYHYAGICVDGVKIGDEDDIEGGIYKSTLYWLTRHGIINFVGENKPAIKVDRCSFVNKIHIDEAEQLFADYLREVIRFVNEHINKYHIIAGSFVYQSIWKRIIDELPGSLQIQLTNLFDKCDYPEITSGVLSRFFESKENIPAIMSSQSVILSEQQFASHNGIQRNYPEVNAFLLKKLSALKSVKALPDGKLQLMFGELPILPFLDNSISKCAIAVPEDNGIFMDYDIVDDFYPLVSHRLFEKVNPENRCCSIEQGVGILSRIKFVDFVVEWMDKDKAFRVININNKKIKVFSSRNYGNKSYYFDLFDNQGYISLFILGCHMFYDTGCVSMIIITGRTSGGFVFVVDGILTRGEMDEIYAYLVNRSFCV